MFSLKNRPNPMIILFFYKKLENNWQTRTYKDGKFVGLGKQMELKRTVKLLLFKATSDFDLWSVYFLGLPS